MKRVITSGIFGYLKDIYQVHLLACNLSSQGLSWQKSHLQANLTNIFYAHAKKEIKILILEVIDVLYVNTIRPCPEFDVI